MADYPGSRMCSHTERLDTRATHAHRTGVRLTHCGAVDLLAASRDSLLRNAIESPRIIATTYRKEQMMTNDEYADELDLCRTAAERGYRLVKIYTDDLSRLELSPSTAVYALVDIACDGGGDEPMTALAEIGGLDIIAEQLAERVCD
jgi:hypothetical protein